MVPQLTCGRAPEELEVRVRVRQLSGWRAQDRPGATGHEVHSEYARRRSGIYDKVPAVSRDHRAR
jgi:hypothetical protein